METYWREQKRWTKYILAYTLILAGLSVLSDQMPFAKAVVIGGGLAVLNFRLLALSAQKAVTMTPSRAQRYAFSQYFIRYTLTGIVLALVLMRPDLNLLGAILGLLSLKLLLYGYAVWGSIIAIWRSWVRPNDNLATKIPKKGGD